METIILYFFALPLLVKLIIYTVGVIILMLINKYRHDPSTNWGDAFFTIAMFMGSWGSLTLFGLYVSMHYIGDKVSKRTDVTPPKWL